MIKLLTVIFTKTQSITFSSLDDSGIYEMLGENVSIQKLVELLSKETSSIKMNYYELIAEAYTLQIAYGYEYYEFSKIADLPFITVILQMNINKKMIIKEN